MTLRPGLTRALDGIARRGDADSQFGHLLDLQFWLMGRDVEHPGGNVLRRLEFVREEAPGRGRPSRYRRDEADAQVVIWPCGMFLGGDGDGCLLVRGQQPKTMPDATAACLHDPSEVLHLALQGTAAQPESLAHASRWLATYEREVEELAGIEHRVPKPGTTPTLAPPEPWSLAVAWEELAGCFGNQGAHPSPP